jgi:adenosine kinase
MKIWVSGSIARDLIMDFPGRFAEHIDPRKLHILNLSFAVKALRENIGGTAANIAYNLTFLGERPEILGSIGFDQQGLRDYLRTYKVGIRGLNVSKRFRTAAAYIITDRDDNQLAGFYAGAMLEPLKWLPPARLGDWAIVAAEHTANMVRLARFYQKRGVNFIFDPGQQITALTDLQLSAGIAGGKILIGNDYEIGLAQKRVRVRCPVVVRTFGPKGSEIVVAGKKKIRVGIAKPRRVVDPTGAGDAYRAGFLKGLLIGYNLKTCGQIAATVASYAVEEYGTQNHKFTWLQIKRRHNLNFKDKI